MGGPFLGEIPTACPPLNPTMVRFVCVNLVLLCLVHVTPDVNFDLTHVCMGNGSIWRPMGECLVSVCCERKVEMDILFVRVLCVNSQKRYISIQSVIWRGGGSLIVTLSLTFALKLCHP